ncbi:divergent protein kinase domain 1C-like [Glandiceps talaboti]
MRVHKKQLLKAVTVCFIVGVVVYVFHHGPRKVLHLPERCTDEYSKKLLQTLCDLYQANKIDGNLCPNLCTEHSIQYKSCLYFKRGKKVMLMDWNQEDVILKAKHSNLDAFYHLLVKFTQNDKTVTHIPDVETFKKFVHDSVYFAFGRSQEFDKIELLKRMWTKNIESVESMTLAEKESLWSLLQQDEYIYMKYFNDKHLPKVFGSCGHFYAMEYIPTGKMLNPSILSLEENFNAAPWPNRARIALGFLDLIANLDNAYGDVMHLCDVKNENFGVRKDFSIVAIDIDMAFLNKHMEETLAQPNCTTNEECDFFDCHGNCDMKTKKCTKDRKDHNLQAICRKIFMSKNGFPGLLRYPPPSIYEKVNELLQKCVVESDFNQMASKTDVYKKLYVLLSDSLSIPI